MTITRIILDRVLPGIVFAVTFGFAACSSAQKSAGNCPPGSGGATTATTLHASSSSSSSSSSGAASGVGGSEPETQPSGTFTSSSDPGNTFDHFDDPGADGSLDPLQVLAQREAEGPPEIRTRLHSCSKVAYASLGNLLTSLGVNLNSMATGTNPPTAGQVYTNGGDAYGVAKYDAREAETYFHTTASATKLFDIFVQAAPEIIANIQSVPFCQYNGVGNPMFESGHGQVRLRVVELHHGPARDRGRPRALRPDAPAGRARRPRRPHPETEHHRRGLPERRAHLRVGAEATMRKNPGIRDSPRAGPAHLPAPRGRGGAAFGLERSHVLNYLFDEGGGDAVAGTCPGVCQSVHLIGGNGSFAWFQQLWPHIDVATTTDPGNQATFAYYAYGNPGTLYQPPAPNNPFYYAPDAPWMNNGTPTYPVSAFMVGQNETHTQTPTTPANVSTGSSMLATVASIQCANPVMLPVIGVVPLNFGVAPGAPGIATVPNAAGMVALFNSAASQLTLKATSNAQLFETYYRAVLGLRDAAGRPTWSEYLDTTKTAPFLVGQNLSTQLTPTAADLAAYGVTALRDLEHRRAGPGAAHQLRDGAHHGVAGVQERPDQQRDHRDVPRRHERDHLHRPARGVRREQHQAAERHRSSTSG